MAVSFSLFTRKNLFNVAFFVFLIAFLWLILSLLSPFLTSFLWAVIIAMVFYPVYQKVHQWTGRRQNLAAFLTTAGVLLALGLPGFFILVNLGHELARTYEALSTTSWEETGHRVIERIRFLDLEGLLKRWGIQADQAEQLVREGITNGLKSLSSTVIAWLSEILRNMGVFAVRVFFIAVALFFFFRDGARYSRKAIDLLPMETDHREQVVGTLSVTVSAVVRAMFLTAMTQGLMAGAGFAVAGVPLPVVFGFITFITSFIPFLGAASVWIPGVLWLFGQDQVPAALGLAVWGALISSVDNVIKPLIIGGEAKLPIFLLFFTILGGLKVYGFLGVFLGPVILSLALALLAIYKEVYLEGAPPPSRREGSRAGRKRP
jgi:predicted PurR-regulated permease PerM